MSGSTLSEETDGFITCSICFFQFDQIIRVPKCLPCSHLFCSSCLKVKFYLKNGLMILCY